MKAKSSEQEAGELLTKRVTYKSIRNGARNPGRKEINANARTSRMA